MATDKCLVESCKTKEAVNCKGLCMKCYSSSKKLVDKGETTWERLAEVGLARLEPDVFTRAFHERTRGA